MCNDIESNPGPIGDNVYKKYEIGHANARSLTAIIEDPLDTTQKICKFDLIKNHILFYEYDVFGISETWLDDTIDSADIKIDGYHDPIRRDYNRNQRGIMVYISKSCPARHRQDLEPVDGEVICVELQSKFRKTLICNCYRVQNYDIIDYCTDIDLIIDKASEEFQDIFIMGDMNARNSLFWNEDITNTEGHALNALFHNFDFEQLIHEPTRIVGNTKSCLDLLFTNNCLAVSEVGTRDKIVNICDHHPIYATLKHTKSRPKSYKRWVWDFKRGEYDQFSQLLLNAPWHECYLMNNVNGTIQNWMELFVKCAEHCIPHYEATIRPRDKDFITPSIRKLMHKRDKLFRIYKETKCETIGNEHRHLRNKVVSAIRQSKKINNEKNDNFISNVDVSSKKWWKLSKVLMGNVQDNLEGPLLNNHRLITDDCEKANLINDSFVSQTNLDTSNASLPNDALCNTLSISPLTILPLDVYEVLVKLDPDKATGPDGIGNRLFIEAAVPIAEPLSNLFNFCMGQGYFPDLWKIAQVVPVFKKGDPFICTNYRPISLLVCISKFFERLLFNHIYNFLRRNKLLNKRQSGFIPCDSTVNQLIAICNKLYSDIDRGDEIIGVFLDLTKAFDKVWHEGLLFKLKNIGIHGDIYRLLSSYLSDRKQFVVINGSKSDLKPLFAGVPQGSVLGPLLFLIYINDISEDLTNPSFLFADDTSLFSTIQNGELEVAVQGLNSDLKNLDRWTKQWLVTVNKSKTVAMLFSRKARPSQLPPIRMGDSILNVVTSHKHLGMIFNSTLTWDEHINSTTAKCNRILGMLKRFKYRWTRKSLEICYKSFVRPIIEYGNIIYDCCTLGNSNKIEEVQLEAARLVTGAKRYTSHESLYNELGWQTLKERRYITKLSKMFSIVKGIAPTYLFELISQFQLQGNHNTRAHSQGDFEIPKANTTLYFNSFVVSAISQWNKLDKMLKQVGSLPSFKYHLIKLHSRTPHRFNHNAPRENQVAFMQIRMGFSNLNSDLYIKGCIENGSCACGNDKEDAKHFFLQCNNYVDLRQKMFTKMYNINVNPTLALILKGSNNLNDKDNMLLFESVYEFIHESKRFKYCRVPPNS